MHTFGDAHLYDNHREQADLQLSRVPLPLPTLHLNPEVTNLFEFGIDDFELRNYRYHEAIKAPIAV